MSQFYENTIVDLIWACRLPIGRALRKDSTSSILATILLNPTLSNRGNSGRATFSSFNIVCLQKKSFKTLDLSKSSECIVPSWSKGGIDDLYSGKIKDLRVVHQPLEVSALFYFNSVAKLSKRNFLESRIAVTISFLIYLTCAQ